jgi:gamma-butyrobetaine dioxygenase
VAQALGFPAVWLRHNCPCPDCRDPVTGQRLVEITQISNGTVASVTAELADSLEVTFTPDGHRSVFSRAWLAASALDADADVRTEDGKVLWRAASAGAVPAADMAGASAPELAAVPTADWAAYLTDDEVREYLLDAVPRYGAGLLRGVPAEDGMVTAVAETFGYVRETNYGRIFDVRVVADPANLAFTSRAIAPHTDNPYRDPVPTLQLLHCLRDADLGGDTLLVDGFAAAAALRAADPVSFGMLTTTPVPFSYVDKETSLTACQPLIALSPRGRIACVRLNNRSMQPVRLPFDQAEAVYAAYRAWAEMVARPEFALRLRLAPGDCLVFDNTRILHARSAFSSSPVPVPSLLPDSGPASSLVPASDASDGAGVSGVSGVGKPSAGEDAPASAERHLQGCYADLDGLLSTLAVLRSARASTNLR